MIWEHSLRARELTLHAMRKYGSYTIVLLLSAQTKRDNQLREQRPSHPSANPQGARTPDLQHASIVLDEVVVNSSSPTRILVVFQ